MDSGPFRGARPPERRVQSQPTVQQPPQAPQPVPEAPAYHTAPHVAEKQNPLKRFLLPIGIIALLLIAATGWFMWQGLPSTSTGIDSKEYQAVFLSNGQVYFGKLKAFNGGYMKLTNIFYLQTQNSDTKDSSNPQNAGSNSQSNVQLIKLGSEIHGPEDEMFIAKDQMLFYENLKSDSKVVQTINQSQK